MKEELKSAERAALEAGKILMKHYGRVKAGYKKDGSVITLADGLAEDKIRSILSKDFPGYSFLGEETGLDKRDSEFTWVVDPLDGTTNYSMRNPLFNTAIALVKGDVPVMGVVYCPVQDEMFTAAAGKGAFLNGNAIRVSSTGPGEKSHTGFCHSRSGKTIDEMSRIFSGFKRLNDSFRQYGAAELELAYVASGRLDAFLSIGLNPWDVMAGSVLIKEAGGIVTDFQGNGFRMDSKTLIATNANLAGFMRKKIREFL